jgi:spore cortex formation protein SpoVR/YcgB (stage V sporulation)
MLDAYSAMGMPLMYHHWSFGKLFAREGLYRAGHRRRARWSSTTPCISICSKRTHYDVQTIVIAHAAGHNHFLRTIICSGNGRT